MPTHSGDWLIQYSIYNTLYHRLTPNSMLCLNLDFYQVKNPILVVIYTHDYTYTHMCVYVQSHINLVYLTRLSIEVDLIPMQYT